MENKKIKCSNCEYEWETDSKMFFVTCPSCRLKTKNNNLNKKEDDKNGN